MKSKLLMTSTILSQVLHPMLALADNGIGDKSVVRQQLEDYFNQEKSKAKATFVTRNFYQDNYVDPATNKTSVHSYSVSVAMLKLATPISNDPGSYSSSSSSPGGEGSSSSYCDKVYAAHLSAPTGNYSFDYQFVFKREDVTATLTEIWGDQKDCGQSIIGEDHQGNNIVRSLCKNDDEDIYYGNITEDTPDKTVYSIAKLSNGNSSTSTETTVTDVSQMVVWKLADGKTVVEFQAVAGSTDPVNHINGLLEAQP